MKVQVRNYLEDNVFGGKKKIYQDTHKGNIFYDVICDNKNEAYKIIEDNNKELLSLGYFIYDSGLHPSVYLPDNLDWFTKKYGFTPSRGTSLYIVRVYPNVLEEVALFPDYCLGGVDGRLTDCLKEILSIKKYGYKCVADDYIVGFFHEKIGREDVVRVRRILTACIKEVYDWDSSRFRELVSGGEYKQFYLGDN